jgi:hypothetical protein
MGRLAWWRTSPTWKYIHQVISSQYLEEYEEDGASDSLVYAITQKVKFVFGKAVAKM